MWPPAQPFSRCLHGPLTEADCAYARGLGRPAGYQFAAASGIVDGIGSEGGQCHLMVDTGINRLGIAPAEGG